MATAQYDKFIELRKSGVDAQSARKQAYGDIPTAPIAPVAPTPIEGATLPITPQVTTPPVTPVTPVQTVTPTPLVEAPRDPTTGLSKPLESAPTTPVVPKETKKDTPIDYTQANGRENEIVTNLEKFKSQNMTPEQIKTASGYNQATPEKKAIIEGFLNPIKQDSGAIFNTLKLGGSVPTSDTPEFKQAQARYNTFKRFSTYDVASLSTAMQSGELLMGTQAYNDVISDPAMLAKVQRARAFSNGEVDIVAVGEKQGQYVMTQNPTVAKALDDGYMSREEYESLTTTSEVEAQAKVVSEERAKYDEYKRQLEQISDDVDAEYANQTTTDSFRSAIKANRDKSIRRLFNSASDSLQNAMGLYTELKSSSTALLEINMKQYEQKQAEEAKIASELRQNQMNRENAVFEADLGLKSKQAEFEQGLAQQAQLAKDPISGTNAIIDTFEKMGIMADRSRQEIIADIQNKVASGIPLGQALSDLQTAFKSKPMYQSMVASQMASLSPKPMEYGFSNIGDGRIAITNPQTGKVSFASAGSVSSANAPTTTSAKYLDIPTGTDVGVQCGTFARQLCGLDATPGGNSLEARIKAFTDPTPVAGGMVLFNGGNYDSTYGHIASIESVNPDGTLNIVESNLNGDNKVTRRTIQANDANISGYYNDTPLAKGTGKPNVEFKPESVPQYTSYLSSGKIGTNAEELKAIKEEFGSIENFKLQAEAYNNSEGGPRQKELDKIEKLRNQVGGLLSDDNKGALSNTVGSIQQTWSPWTARAKEGFIAEIQSLLDGKTLQQLIDVKADGATFGALSNEELRMLQNSASKLNQLAIRDDEKDPNKITGFRGTEDNFKARVDEMIKEYDKMLAKKQKQMGRTTDSSTQITPQDLAELQKLLNP